MKKWILLIGLLTHSSVGWSDTYKMKCDKSYKVNGVILQKGQVDYWKLDTSKSSSSTELLMYRSQGKWNGMCDWLECEKRDGSIFLVQKVSPEMGVEMGVKPSYSEQFLDFKFLSIERVNWNYDKSEVKYRTVNQCERIE